MGEVFRARDTHLERDVAIKLLPDALFADADARRRFRREALALSRLQHPHIAVVHDFAEQEGVPFLVMELIEGESLAQRLGRGPPDEAEVRRLGAEIASALAAAHEQGVIHRDLKPGNVMLTARGQAKVVDFGLARRLPVEGEGTATTMTATDSVSGTLPYMAPEQLLGGAVDGRTDLFALGAVLYECATGRRPFAGATPMALANAIMNHAPIPPRALRPGLSPALETLILRCLEKRPADRFAGAADLLSALVARDPPIAAESEPASVDPPSQGHRLQRPAATVLIAVASVAVVVAGAIWLPRWLHRGDGDGAIHALAVLPLANLSGDPEQEFFADGMTDELIVSLSQIGALRVIPRSSSFTYKGTNKAAQQIGRELKVDALVSGSIQRSGNRVRIRAQLVDASADRSLWADSFEGDLNDVLRLQSHVARAIVERIHPRIEPAERARLTTVRQVDPMAHEAYLRGRHYWNQYDTDGWKKSLDQFQRALEIAPEYAEAYAGMADAYLMLSSIMEPAEALPRARAALAHALALDSTLAAAHAVLGYVQAVYDHDWKQAEASLQRALALNRNQVTAYQNYGYLLHALGRFDEALVQLDHARELDPLSTYVATMSLWPLNQGRRYEEAIARALALVAADTSAPLPRFILGQALCYSGRHAEGIVELEYVARRENVQVLQGWLGWAYGVGGRSADAQRVLEELGVRSRREFVNPFALGLVHLGLGHNDEAIRQLEQAIDAQIEEVVFINVDPAMDPLRAHPRFQQLLRRLGFNE